MAAKAHLLHVFATFARGGPQVRFAVLAEAFASDYRHTIVAVDGNYEASSLLSPAVEHSLMPPPSGKSSLRAPWAFASLLRRLHPGLIQTYNWGAMDAAAGARIARVCPLVHTEDGFGADEAQGLKSRRVWTRRLVLRGAYRTVFPSETLLRIARERYRLPEDRLQLIRNGVDTRRFRPRSSGVTRPAIGLPPDAFVLGAVGRLSPEKNIEGLVRMFAAAAIPGSRLVIVGDGPCRAAVEGEVVRCGVGDRVTLLGAAADTAPIYGLFDLFAMSSRTEQMPMALLEAMACGLPALCMAAGDTRAILDDPRQVVPAGDDEAYCLRMREMAQDVGLRAACGRANRDRCEREYSVERMIAEYRELYRGALTHT